MSRKEILTKEVEDLESSISEKTQTVGKLQQDLQSLNSEINFDTEVLAIRKKELTKLN